MRRRALVAQTRVPEIDRDAGSRRVDRFIHWLLDDGWSVTFVAHETQADPRHVRRLRQLGVPTYVGFDDAELITLTSEFDLALLAYWEPASELLPIVREASPDTRIIVDSQDVHFLRDARRLVGAGAAIDERAGQRFAGELNAYRAADAVLAVSEKETALLGDFLGPERIYHVPLAEPPARSPVPVSLREGILFVGNFRHLPNGEAVEFLCREVLPRLDPDLLAAHPLSVVGSRLDEKVREHGRGMPGVKMVGWVPSIRPYLERARVCAVPMLHGAGVKSKVVEALLSGTPVLTTPIGAEGTGLRPHEHAVIAESPVDLAAGLAHLLTDTHEWWRMADAGYELAAEAYDPRSARDEFLRVVSEVLELPTRQVIAGRGIRRARGRELAYQDTVAAVTETLTAITDPGSTVLVVSRGDDRLVDFEGRHGAHFPQAPDGRWAGYHPADSDTAISHLESLRDRDARYLAIPSSSFWWLHHYSDLAKHLDARYRRVHSGEHLVVFDLAEPSRRLSRAQVKGAAGSKVAVAGTYRAGRAGPSPAVVAELDRSELFAVTQTWRSDHDPAWAEEDDADWTLFVEDTAVLPSGFLDEFLVAAGSLAELGIERFQPSHVGGPTAAPPVTERIRGVFGREVEGVTPLPVLAVRRGAAPVGPAALLDSSPIGLSGPLDSPADAVAYSNVRDVFVHGDSGPERAVQRSQGPAAPLVSVLIATYERPELLAKCLEGFHEQTLSASEFEVIVVDDGSEGPETQATLLDFAPRLPLRWLRTAHAGRSAAKNLAVLLARGDVVLFFDDDDVPAPELLAEHLRTHEQNPDEGVAVLGHTAWAPELAVTPLMHYLTNVDKLLFAYGNLDDDGRYDWRCFWEGRVSSKRSLHLRHGLHDQRLEYSIDVEMAWRLAPEGLQVIYQPAARSFMARSIDFDSFARRWEAKGRAQAAIAALHSDPEVIDYAKVDGAAERWQELQSNVPALVARIHELEASLNGAIDGGPGSSSELEELHEAYRAAFSAFNAKGVAEASGAAPAQPSATANPRPRPARPKARRAFRNGNRRGGGDEPALTVTMPVLSRTEKLADMAMQMIERVWEVSRIPTEVVVVDNGSAIERPFRARVHRFEENRGVATGWNTGIELARAPVVAVLNSDCRVEPGWDEALYEAVLDGPRIAFPYTDHCDGRGFRQPDQAGTAGWCFMLAMETFREIGPFDERFNPAYCEDTDYWHRAWELGIELSPVPAARVTHARRTSAGDATRAEWLLNSHRYLYGWKHQVEPMAAPPYYNREIVEYVGTQRAVSGASTT